MPTPPKFRRKNIRLPSGCYSGPGAYFVTLCFHNRHRFGTNPRLVAWLVEQLRKHAAASSFHIHAYCVMPDHVHVLAAAASEDANLIKLVDS
ncbi:MAG: transposase, partial [Candidatus Acidiferrales bacterium]